MPRIALSTLLVLLFSLAPLAAMAQSLSFSNPPTTVGSGLQTDDFYIILSESQHGGIYLSVTSSDSSVALVAPDQITPGSGTASHFIPNGTTYAQFAVQGLENLTGSVTLIATAPGFSNAQATIEVVAPHFRVEGLASTVSVIDPDDLFFIQTGYYSGPSWLSENVRTGGPGLTATATVSDPAVAQLVTSSQSGQSVTVSILGGQSQTPGDIPSGGVAFAGLNAGNTDLTVSIPGFIAEEGGVIPVSVEAATISYLGLPMDLCAGLRSRNGSLSFVLNGTDHGGTTVQVSSLDPGRVLVAPDNTSLGEASVEIFVPDGQQYGVFYLHALELVSGVVPITASAPGFISAEDGVDVIEGGMEILYLGDTIDALAPVDEFAVRVGTPTPSGSHILEPQPVRPGSPGLQIALVSNNPTVGLLETATDYGDTVWVQIHPGWMTSPLSVGTGGVAFDGVGAGTTLVQPVSEGFVPTLAGLQTVTVTQPTLSIPNVNNYTVGSGLQVFGLVLLSAPLHGGTTVRIAVDDPTKALIADGSNSPGAAFQDFFVADGSTSAQFYLQGLEDLEDVVSVSASAPGFADNSQVFNIVTPAISIQWASYYVSTLGNTQSEITAPDEFVAEIGIPSGSLSVLPQALRVGSPGIDVTAQVDDPVVGGLITSTSSDPRVIARIEATFAETPATLSGGGFAFDGLSAGAVNVSVSAPGFTQQDRASQGLVVQAASFLSNPPNDVGSGLVGDPNNWQMNGTDHGGTLVHLEVSDPSLALLSPDALTPGQATLDIEIPDGSPYVQFQVHALENVTGTVNVTASADGFVTSTAPMNVVQPYLGMNTIPATQDINSPPGSIVVQVGTPNWNNSAIWIQQPRRPGGPPLIATVASSNPAVAEIMDLSGAGLDRDITFDEGSATTPGAVALGGLGLSGVGPGTVLVDATIPGFLQVGSATQEVTVVQNGIALLGFPAALGAGLQTETLVARLNTDDHGGTTVSLSTSNPQAAVPSSGPAYPGSDSIEVFVPDGQQDAVFHLQSVSPNPGGVNVYAEVDGSIVASRYLEIATPGVAISALTDSLRVDGADDAFVVQVGLPMPNSSDLAVTQAISAGADPFTCPVVLDDGSAADLVTLGAAGDSLDVTIAPGAFQSPATVAAGGVALSPLSTGPVTVSARPEGFTLTVAASPTVVIYDDLTGTGPTPLVTALNGNYPNPFNPMTRIDFSLAQSGPVQLDIHDLRGFRVRRLVAEVLPTGNHQVSWDGTDDAGRMMAAGVYFVRLQAPEGSLTRKMTLVK